MSDPVYDELPDEPEVAFVYLEQHFRKQLDESLKNNDQSSFDAYCRRKYMSAVIAAAKSLDIPGIKDLVAPYREKEVWELFEGFETDVMSLIIQIEINHARRRRNYSVEFDSITKQKIRHYIDQIRTTVEQSDLPQNKRDAIFKKLSELTLEIDRSRTRFEVVADAIRGVARLSGDVEREGAEPWWKWIKLIFGEIDDAKEKETKSQLPSPRERKRIEPPRQKLLSPDGEKSNLELDDDIPF